MPANPEHEWGYTARGGAASPQIAAPRGKALGGSSAHAARRPRRALGAARRAHHGFSRAFMVAAGFAVLGIVLALLFVQNSRPAAGDKIVSADAEESLATTAA